MSSPLGDGLLLTFEKHENDNQQFKERRQSDFV